MSEEVKEILDKIETLAKQGYHDVEVYNNDCQSKYSVTTYSKLNEIRLYGFSAKLLYDYITNLQKENEELRRLQANIDKALEYIKRELKNFYNKNKNCKYLGEILELESIEEILSGDE